MTAGERMTRSFDVIHPDVLLAHVASHVDSHTRPILVCEHDRLIGVLDAEALRAARWLRAGDVRPPRVRDAVVPDVLFCLESTDLAEAAALMREHRVQAIPVLSADRRLVGVVALEDVPTEVLPGPNSPSPADRKAQDPARR
jgi:CBS-domain-containing membrane protein